MVRLETATFRALTEDLGNPGCALNFLGDYLRMLPGRMGRIVSHVWDQGGNAPWTLLILRVSSTMTSAQEARV